MNTTEYRWVVAGQITGVCVMGLVAAIIFLSARSDFRSREYLSEAVGQYSMGTEASAFAAQKSLDCALAIDPAMIPCIAMRGRVALRQGDVAAAKDAYGKLERILQEKFLPTAPALNGLGCTALLEDKQRPGPEHQARLKQAYDKFKEAIKQEPTNGDAHVNAAICCLHMNDLLGAASNLASARATKNLSYASVIAYYSAIASLLTAASERDQKAAFAVVREFADPNPDLWKPDQLLLRSTDEFNKALELAGNGQEAAELRVKTTLAKAITLVAASAIGAKTRQFISDINQALSKYAGIFSVEQRQRLSVAIMISNYRMGSNEESLRWARSTGAYGELPLELGLQVGAVMFQLAQTARTAAERRQIETEASNRKMAALSKPKIRPALRFRTLCDLAIGEWKANDTATAVKHMNDAASLLDKMESAPREAASLTKAEKSRFYRNLAVMLYTTGAGANAAASRLRQSIELDASQNTVRQFLAKLSGGPVIEDIRTMAADKLPQSMPIITAKVTGNGPVLVRKEDISVEIDAERVGFICGPDNRIYALPPKALAEGTHRIAVTVAAPGEDKPISEQKVFEVKYKYKPEENPKLK